VRRAAAAALALLVVAGAAGCGGKTVRTPQQQAQDQAAKIQSRLKKAGYTIEGLSPTLVLSPQPVEGFRVQADFTSPHSYTVTVLVYATPAQAQLFAKRYTQECQSYPPCKALGDAQQLKVVDNVVYSAQSDNGRSPLPKDEFAALVAAGEGS
jgi:hypothetical protein